MVSAVIFDCDNTLMDYMRMKRVTCEHAIEAMMDVGLEMEKRAALDLLYNLYKKDGLDDHTIFQRFLRRVEGKIDHKKLAHAIVAYRRARIGVLHSYPGTKRTLIALKERGLKLGVVSDASNLKLWTRLTAMSLDDFFEVVVGFDDTQTMKPARQPFYLAVSELGVAPEECVMIGDMPQRDILGAKRLGMTTCFAAYGYEGSRRNSRADFVLNSISEVPRIVDALRN
ncbi:HAD-IA family hydrolase [Candidatus Woesearchaeota archaeon]|nr:HAD-IA family hydrolase [Candidatus Woesearchaeota archaeon]